MKIGTIMRVAAVVAIGCWSADPEIRRRIAIFLLTVLEWAGGGPMVRSGCSGH